MKISIENLGCITHAEFELKPLTVFIGDNQRGKTQTIVTATTMLGSYGRDKYISHLLSSSELSDSSSELSDSSSELGKLISEIDKHTLDGAQQLQSALYKLISKFDKHARDEEKTQQMQAEFRKLQTELCKLISEIDKYALDGARQLQSEFRKLISEIDKVYTDLTTISRAEIDLDKFSSQYLIPYYVNLGKVTPNYLYDILGYTVPVERTAVTYTLSEMERAGILSKIRDLEIRNIDLSPTEIKIVKERDCPLLYLYVDAGQKITLPKVAIIRILLNFVFGQFLNIRNIHLFPSERAGFSLFINEIQKYNNQPARQPDENSPNIHFPYTLTEYMTLIHQILRTGSINKRQEAARKNPEIANIMELSALFTTITKDTISLSSPEPDPLTRKVQIQVHDTVLDVQEVSSGVKGLIGLALYLQYEAQPGDLIVIDEPEQNLHPHQQAAFAEYLTLLVNNGIRVAITTHSPYIVEHLQNLIIAHDLKDKKEIIDGLYLKREDSFIDTNKVGIYLFQNSTAESILMKNGEINWQTFCDTANIIGNTKAFIYDKQQEEQEDRE